MLLKGKASLPPSASPGRSEASQRAAGTHKLGVSCFPITAAHWGVGMGASLVFPLLHSPPCSLGWGFRRENHKVEDKRRVGRERLLWASEARPLVSLSHGGTNR